ncbi:MAG TPA: hypothetical protein VKA63_05045 [Candidatus Krumholzibacteria bacterium]|nr:hypothetical protein [Candidatus Krumholzibacteria bacterium]
MSRAYRRTVLCLLSISIAWVLFFGCAGEEETAPQFERAGKLQEEPWFRSALSLLAAIQSKLSDPVLRTELRIRLLARDEEGAFRRLGFSREDLGAFLARQEILSLGLKQRWPELSTRGTPGPATDSRAEFIEGLQADEWQTPVSASHKEFYTCAIVTFYEEFNRCTAVSQDIYATMGCIITAYWHFLDNLARGC